MTDRPAAPRTDAHTTGLLRFVDACPTPFHAAAEAARSLRAAGFVQLDETAAWPHEPGRYLVVRGGALLAWIAREGDTAYTPFRLIGTHTDSPTLRIKPRPDHVKAGWQMLGVEPYGPPLLNSWLDRDLGLAGRVVVRTAAGPQVRLFDDPRALARVAQLAIHLDRGVNERGLVLNPQEQLVPLWGVGSEPASFPAYLAERVDADPADVLAWDAMLRDVQPAVLLGPDRALVAAPRLDNLASTYAALTALLAVADSGGATGHRPMIVLFDHEEIGSRSESGAASPLLPGVLERIVLAAGGTREDLHRALAGSVVASADMAHAVHPNYAALHEPSHPVRMGEGPVLKVHSELRYATNALGSALLREAAADAGVGLQVFVSRSDLPCGSTIGPITAGQLGVTTVDVGAPLLSMHSIRELAGVPDQLAYAALLQAFLAPAR